MVIVQSLKGKMNGMFSLIQGKIVRNYIPCSSIALSREIEKQVMYGTFYTSFFILILVCKSFVSPFLAKAHKSVSIPRAASEALLLHFPGSSPDLAKSEESPIHHFC